MEKNFEKCGNIVIIKIDLIKLRAEKYDTSFFDV